MNTPLLPTFSSSVSSSSFHTSSNTGSANSAAFQGSTTPSTPQTSNNSYLRTTTSSPPSNQKSQETSYNRLLQSRLHRNVNTQTLNSSSSLETNLTNPQAASSSAHINSLNDKNVKPIRPFDNDDDEVPVADKDDSDRIAKQRALAELFKDLCEYYPFPENDEHECSIPSDIPKPHPNVLLFKNCRYLTRSQLIFILQQLGANPDAMSKKRSLNKGHYFLGLFNDPLHNQIARSFNLSIFIHDNIFWVNKHQDLEISKQMYKLYNDSINRIDPPSFEKVFILIKGPEQEIENLTNSNNNAPAAAASKKIDAERIENGHHFYSYPALQGKEHFLSRKVESSDPSALFIGSLPANLTRERLISIFQHLRVPPDAITDIWRSEIGLCCLALFNEAHLNELVLSLDKSVFFDTEGYWLSKDENSAFSKEGSSINQTSSKIQKTIIWGMRPIQIVKSKDKNSTSSNAQAAVATHSPPIDIRATTAESTPPPSNSQDNLLNPTTSTNSKKRSHLAHAFRDSISKILEDNAAFQASHTPLALQISNRPYLSAIANSLSSNQNPREDSYNRLLQSRPYRTVGTQTETSLTDQQAASSSVPTSISNDKDSKPTKSFDHDDDEVPVTDKNNSDMIVRQRALAERFKGLCECYPFPEDDEEGCSIPFDIPKSHPNSLQFKNNLRFTRSQLIFILQQLGANPDAMSKKYGSPKGSYFLGLFNDPLHNQIARSFNLSIFVRDNTFWVNKYRDLKISKQMYKLYFKFKNRTNPPLFERAFLLIQGPEQENASPEASHNQQAFHTNKRAASPQNSQTRLYLQDSSPTISLNSQKKPPSCSTFNAQNPQKQQQGSQSLFALLRQAKLNRS